MTLLCKMRFRDECTQGEIQPMQNEFSQNEIQPM